MSMRMGYELNIEQMQKLVMTPELIQAIQILQFNTQELDTYLEEQVLVNPLLDVTSPTSEAKEKKEEPEQTNEKQKDQEIDWAEYVKNYDDISYKQKQSSNDEQEHNTENYGVAEVTLAEHLMFQLQFAVTTAKEKKIGRFIIESVDENGYLLLGKSHTKPDETCEEIATLIGESKEDVCKVLSIVQTFDPAGVAARNLKECLKIQILASNCKYKTIAAQMVMDYLEDIGANRLNIVSKAMKISTKRTQEIADYIKTLEPKPGRQFASMSGVKYVIPDVTIEKSEEGYTIVVNDITAPKLYINAHYKKMLMTSDKESNLYKFLTGRLNSAVWLIKSIEQRKQTIYNVVSAIVNYQKDFFEQGKKALKTLTLKQVAEEVGIHESTVSRAINGKYLQCPRGIYEMKYFFSSGIESSYGEGIASEGVKSFIFDLIENENQEKPLSDQHIGDILIKKGINISRRTVAKYRDDMGIPSSSKRKRY